MADSRCERPIQTEDLYHGKQKIKLKPTRSEDSSCMHLYFVFQYFCHHFPPPVLCMEPPLGKLQAWDREVVIGAFGSPNDISSRLERLRHQGGNRRKRPTDLKVHGSRYSIETHSTRFPRRSGVAKPYRQPVPSESTRYASPSTGDVTNGDFGEGGIDQLPFQLSSDVRGLTAGLPFARRYRNAGDRWLRTE